MMEGGEKTGFWVPADGVLRLFSAALEFALSLFRPMAHFLMEVSNGSWLGLCAVVSIFFSIHLIRAGARAGAGNRSTVSQAMEYYSGWGLIASLSYCALLALEWLFIPVLTIIFTACVNSLAGTEPGLGQFFSFLFSPSLERAAFFDDLTRFYGEAHTVMPLGIKFATVIVFLFGTMRIVARGMGRLAS